MSWSQSVRVVEGAAERDGDQAGDQADQQRTWQLAPPLLVAAQEVAHLALQHLRGTLPPFPAIVAWSLMAG